LSQSQQFFETPPPVYDMPPNYNDINSINIWKFCVNNDFLPKKI
jgi:hypothetical protein